jgi:hypothetical protein
MFRRYRSLLMKQKTLPRRAFDLMHRETKAMMKNSASCLAALCATTILTTGAAWAANTTPVPTPPLKEAKATTEQATADKDFGKFSVDGASAFSDITLTRRAIFEGRTDDAKKYVALAEAGFNKAKGDDSVYTKAEGDLKPPAKADTEKAATNTTTPPPDKGAPIAWVPVDGSITIAEDITESAPKKAAVGDANKSLQTGDRDAALKKLKVAGIEVAVVMAVMPIEATIEKVHQAVVMIDAGKYYEGSQELRLAQEGERFDAVGNLGTPKE